MFIENYCLIRQLLATIIFFSFNDGTSQDFVVNEIEKSRIIVLTDMLNEPDDSQTMIRLLMYSNKLDIEGLIAVSSCHQYQGKEDTFPVLKDGKIISVDTIVQERNGVHPQEIYKRIIAYGKVLENLRKHEDNWPSVEYLLSKVGSGPPGYGMSDVGKGKITTGSKLIADALLRDDDRPIYICINAGANTLAQALIDLQSNTSSEKFKRLTRKLRVYDDAGQDDAGAWIAHTFPDIHYQRSQRQVFSFMNSKGPEVWPASEYPGKGQHIWAKDHVQTNHGPLGELYSTRMQWKRPDLFHTIEGGGTSTWIGHVNNGLYVPEEITWGGWGGRFGGEKIANVMADQLKIPKMEETENKYKPFYMFTEASDEWIDVQTGIKYNDIGTPIYRWRQAYQNDFQARMDWCVLSFKESNHNPIAAFGGDLSDGIVYYTVRAGQIVVLDASLSKDPDGDNLTYRWFLYPEAGTYEGLIQISNQNLNKAKFTVPIDARDSKIHLVLEVKDDNIIVPLYDYRRIVINVK